MKYAAFLSVARLLNQRLHVTPLLFGSLGLERRLNTDLNADDIDVLIPERYVKSDWITLRALMAEQGYRVIDESEHEFDRDGIRIAFAGIESLAPFAGIDVSGIPVISDGGAEYMLLSLSDYLKVYTASSKDGYRKNVKHKQDQQKIDWIRRVLESE